MTKNNKPVIAQILPNLQGGGVERGTIELAKELKENYFPIVISNGGNLVKQLENAEIKHIKLPVHSKNPLRIFLNIFSLVLVIKKHDISLIHVRSRAPMISAYFACKLTKIKLVATIHGTYSTKLIGKNSLFKKLYNGFMLKADRVIAVSHFIKDGLIEDYLVIGTKFRRKKKLNWQEKILAKFVPQNKIEEVKVIARGVDLRYFVPDQIEEKRVESLIKDWGLKNVEQKVIFFPARFTAWKGHNFLLDALAKVNHPNYLCIIAGSSLGHEKYKEEITKKIKTLGLQKNVKIVGNCDDMAAAYFLSDIVVSASLRPEAFGRISIEAQAMGKIMIATAIGGSLETIREAQTGFLVEPNDVLELTIAIENALFATKDDVLKIRMAAIKNAKENFSNQKMFEKTIEVYKGLLGTVNKV